MQQFSYGKTTFGESPVDEYITSLSGPEHAAVKHVYDIARQLAPDAEQAVYYGTPCLKYHDKGLVSVMVGKNFLSLYPFSNLEAVVPTEMLAGLETTKGSIHFLPDKPLPDDLLRAILTARMERIG